MYEGFYNSPVSMFHSVLKLLVKADAATQDTYALELTDIVFSARHMGGLSR